MAKATDPQPLSNADRNITDVERLRKRVDALSPKIGNTAYNAAQQNALLMALDGLGHSVATLREMATNMELSPKFGDEDSYWTTYRLFTFGENKGMVFTLDEIWDHLAKNYDMVDETPETLEDTLLEWASDIMTDALSAGVRGVFERNESGFYFAPYQTAGQVETARNSEPVTAITKVQPPVKAQEMPAQTPEELLEASFYEFIIKTLTADGDTKQADIKKAAIKLNGNLHSNALQALIDGYVADGRLFKYSLGGGALLSLTPKESIAKAGKGENDEAEDDRIRALDTDLAAAVLGLLCGPKTQWQQRLDAGRIWKELHRDAERNATPEEEKEIRTVCRLVEDRYKLLTTGQEKIGTGGRAKTKSAASSVRRRSSNQTIFRIGLQSQAVKEQIQRRIAEDGVNGIKQLFDQEPTDENL